jgi:hypothetical protein
MRLKWLFMMCALSAGCGGSTPATETAEDVEDREEARRDDGSQITGILGTISRDAVEGTLSPRMNRFMACLEQRLGDVEFLSGDIRMSFRIHEDGTVSWVYASQSNLGDREAEQCIVSVARSARFPHPHGGEAEFTWGFGFDAPEDVRPPLSWDASALGDRVDDVPEVARECSANGSYQVTAYVQPGGRVLAAGGSAPSAEGDGVLDCILARVREWEMPNPGSYAAKVTFPVQ